MGEAPSAFPGRQKGFLGARFEGSTLRDGEQGLYIREPPRQQDFQLSKYLQALHRVFFSLANRVKPLSANIGQASQNISVPPKNPKAQVDVETVSFQDFCNSCSTYLIRLV